MSSTVPVYSRVFSANNLNDSDVQFVGSSLNADAEAAR